MNKTQLEYAVQRIKSISSEKLSKLQVFHTKKGRIFDGPALVDAIKKGKVTALPESAGRNIGSYDDIRIVFAGYEGLGTPDVLDKAAFVKASEPIHQEHARILDQLYLGDAKVALDMIEAFAAKKF